MTPTNIFMLDPGLLGDLDVKDGTALLGSLLRCEATRLSLPLEHVVISSRTSAKDGGIDAKVEAVPADAALLKRGSTYFQIKTGSSFKPWLKAHLIKELFGAPKAKPSKARLGKEVKRCLDGKGHYTLVTLGHDLLPSQHSEAVELLTELLRKVGYKKPRIGVLGQGQTVRTSRQLPLALPGLEGLGSVAVPEPRWLGGSCRHERAGQSAASPKHSSSRSFDPFGAAATFSTFE